MSVIIFFIILIVLVVVHEFGHFFAAKRFGIRVDEFGFGFPPKLFGKKFGETEYTINLLPLGGFVKIFGENPEEEAEPLLRGSASQLRSFINKAKWKQAIVLFAGIFMNFLLAWFLFSIGFMSGLPTSVGSEPAGYTLSNVHLTVLSVSPKSPAENAGLKTGDKIISVKSGNDFITDINPDTMKAFVLSHPDGQIEIGYLRGQNGESFLEITPAESHGMPIIGISMDEIGTAKLSLLRSFWEGASLTVSVTKDTAVGLYTLIKQSFMGKADLSSVTGPVGMVSIVGQAYSFGFSYLLSFAALISVNLGIINLIPFPALDGGRLFFLLIEKIKGSRINPRVANMANMIGFGILIMLMLVVTYHDVVKLF